MITICFFKFDHLNPVNVRYHIVIGGQDIESSDCENLEVTSDGREIAFGGGESISSFQNDEELTEVNFASLPEKVQKKTLQMIQEIFIID
jgi:hypothetical protein